MGALTRANVVIIPAVDRLLRDTTDLLVIARDMQRRQQQSGRFRPRTFRWQANNGTRATRPGNTKHGVIRWADRHGFIDIAASLRERDLAL
jgi:hypothetical protein